MLPPPRLILGVESSCDETGVALVALPQDGAPRLLAHALHSQIDMHQAYGGVVPSPTAHREAETAKAHRG